MVKLQPMERTSHALEFTNVKLRETSKLFRLHQTKHSGAPPVHVREVEAIVISQPPTAIAGHIQ